MSAPPIDAPTRRAPNAPNRQRPQSGSAQPPVQSSSHQSGVILQRLVLGLITVLAAAVAWWRIYPPLSLPVPALSGTLLGAMAVVFADRATAGLPALRGLARLALGLVAALVAGLITAMTVAVPRSTAPADAVTGVIEAVTGGISRILTTTLPAPPAADLLPQFAVLCALAAAATAAIARSRGGLALAAPALCLLLTALICGVGGAGDPLWVALPFVLATGFLVLARPNPVSIAVTTVVLALGCAGGLAVGGLAREPMDPRHLTAPPLKAEQPTAPMDELAGWLRHSGDTAFEAQVDAAWQKNPQPWRIATLDTYDGIRWSSSTPAVPVGYDLPESEETRPPLAQSEVSVTPVALEGVYVPVTGRVGHLARPGMTYDLRAETLVDPEGLNGTYEQTVTLGETEKESLAGTAAGRAGSGDPSRSLEGCTDGQIVRLAQSAVAGADGRPLSQALALQTWFSQSSGLKLDPEAMPGHSCGRVLELFGANGSGNGNNGNDANQGNGTPDQFATAYVLMARSLGLPARVAVGFAAGRADESGKVTVSFGDADAWPEIWFQGQGWVPFSATPDRSGSSAPLEQEEQQQEQPTQQPEPPKEEPADTGPPQEGSLDQAGTAEAETTDWTPLIAAVAVVLALLLALPVVGAVVNVLRRRRRQAAGALGAWAELLDRLADLGHPSAGRTSLEVRRLLTGVEPGTGRDVDALGRLVDAQVYGGSSRGADPQAWGHLRQIEKALAPHRPWARRLARAVDPRPRRWA
ncbi:transglutaminase domain-containing protein [Kineosporia rhizophila]|uniref:DUF4129 domain-containing transglutaminase family protein n=1 Tax=Kineosporia TaxID=49184 RepID=UPI001E424723|nr:MULTISPECIES: transglutaminase domain-containing protein [Kineosporia]MCE0535203.1 transglutaminase domain-containing protein [Kineosporia rhizophila]GLY17021.1 hypothetical protein Kisp01_40360 [Kineosporia sp. NBRC 101677]